jgi:hypothetical protein
VPGALDDAELLERLNNAIADAGRLLAELGRLRDVVTARIPTGPEILADEDDEEADFRPDRLLWPNEAAATASQRPRPHWRCRTNVWRKVTSPARGRKLQRSGPTVFMTNTPRLA